MKLWKKLVSGSLAIIIYGLRMIKKVSVAVLVDAASVAGYNVCTFLASVCLDSSQGGCL